MSYSVASRTANIAWSAAEAPLADAEYLAAMRAVVMPLIKVIIRFASLANTLRIVM
jgi:hypothetical protein